MTEEELNNTLEQEDPSVFTQGVSNVYTRSCLFLINRYEFGYN